ncbi:hypothetical protein BHE74_00027922 [Ensete ventricosum]|nr:hypothetical protein BHE74_00027922 [Ensete ventricosum]
MASDSNNGPHQESMNSLFHHPRMVSFQLGATDSSTGMISGDCSLNENGSMASMFMSAGSSMINHMDATTLARYPAGSVVSEPMPRFVHVSGSPAYWSPEEVELLNIGLIKYVLISIFCSILNQKFALIQFIVQFSDLFLHLYQYIVHFHKSQNKENGKRRKVEENYATKKVKDMKLIVSVLNAEILRLLDENDGCLRVIARNLNGGMV